MTTHVATPRRKERLISPAASHSSAPVSPQRRRYTHKRHTNKVKRKKRLLGFGRLLVVALLLYGLWYFWQLPLWKVTAVQFDGLSPYSQPFVQAFMRHTDLKNKHLMAINPVELQNQLLEYPLLKEVQVIRHLWPARLDIRLAERVPYYRVYLESRSHHGYHDKDSVLIDREGKVLVLPAGTKPEKQLMLSMTHPNALEQISPEQLEVGHRLNQLYEAKRISMPGVYNIANPANIILKSPQLKHPVWLGSLEDLPIKLRLLDPLQPLIQKQSSAVAYVDLRFWKHPVLKLKNSSVVQPLSITMDIPH